MDLIEITEPFGFKSPVFGENRLLEGNTYYTFSLFAKQICELGAGEIIEKRGLALVHFSKTHLEDGKQCKRVLLFFAGGLGDAIMLGSVLPVVACKYQITFDLCCDPVKWKYLFAPLGFSGACIPYPPELQSVLSYDAVLTDITQLYDSRSGLTSSPVLTLCRAFGIDSRCVNAQYRIPFEERQRCKLPPEAKVRLGVNFESNGVVKSYPPALQRVLVKSLLTAGFEVYLFGKDISGANVADMPNAHDLRGKTSISQLAAVIQQMDMVLGVDSFVVHLSNVLKRPTTVLLSTTHPGSFSWHRYVFCLSSGLECAPCLALFNDCPLGHDECRAFYNYDIQPEAITRSVVERAAEHFRDSALAKGGE